MTPMLETPDDNSETVSHRRPGLSNGQSGDAGGSAHYAAYYVDPAGRQSAMRAFFNQAARQYDPVNLLFSLGSGGWYRRSRLRRSGLGRGQLVVDVAVGTGLLAREAVALCGDADLVIGVDVSEAMLAIAKAKLGIALIQGSAEALPLASGIADFVTMGYALRHMADLRAALREALRVLRPGGKIVLLEISAPGQLLHRLLAAAYIGGILPVISLLMTRDRASRILMRYHWRSIASFMPPAAVMQELEGAGFGQIRCDSEFDLFRHYTASKAESWNS
jgi:demethylmenaquinone methyltransferase/2-methoxy-6-polyprenyl-1,4-benzoquinol methylase